MISQLFIFPCQNSSTFTRFPKKIFDIFYYACYVSQSLMLVSHNFFARILYCHTMLTIISTRKWLLFWKIINTFFSCKVSNKPDMLTIIGAGKWAGLLSPSQSVPRPPLSQEEKQWCRCFWGKHLQSSGLQKFCQGVWMSVLLVNCTMCCLYSTHSYLASTCLALIKDFILAFKFF